MKLSLKAMPKWLWVPPAVALLLVLGPLSMNGGKTPETKPPAAGTTGTDGEPAPESASRDSGRTPRAAPILPKTPDAWQMVSALVGVLLLGAAGIVMLRKLRGGATPVRGAAPLLTLRQTLRLSTRQAVHAIEFDDRVLLIGEHERGITLLDSGRLPDRAADEAEVLARHAVASDDGDEGAVPKDLVIPRPPRPAARAAANARVAAAPAVDLNDFRTLLQKVGRP